MSFVYDPSIVRGVWRDSVQTSTGGDDNIIFTDEGEPDGGGGLPPGVEAYMDGSDCIGLTLLDTGLYWCQYSVGVDTSGGAYDVYVKAYTDGNGGTWNPLAWPHLKVDVGSIAERDTRIMLWTGLIPNLGSDPTNLEMEMHRVGGGAKLSSAYIVANPVTLETGGGPSETPKPDAPFPDQGVEGDSRGDIQVDMGPARTRFQ